MMYQGFMKLSNEELRLLEGKIAQIDVQNGCPHQCTTCGTRAPKYKGSMPWKDFKIISDSIMETKIIKGIDLLNNERDEKNFNHLVPFWASDPIYYRSMDGKKERTLYDVVMNFHNNLSKTTLITTAGWRPGDNYMQRAAEKIVEAHTDPTLRVKIGYSLKTVTPNVMRDYDEYLARTGNNPWLMKNFLTESKYLSHVLDNLRTLYPILTDPSYNKLHKSTLSYGLQWIENTDLLSDSFPIEYDKYSMLFSEYFMDYLGKEISGKFEQIGYCVQTFGGIGSALDMGLTKAECLQKTEAIINTNSKRYVNTDLYHVMLNAEGRLNIYYGNRNSLEKIYVPKEHFQILSEKSHMPRMRKKYEMLANLQGRKLLD